MALLTFAVFLPSLRNGFVNWDDSKLLVNNPHFRGFGWENLRWMFGTSHMGIYQPLSWLSYALDFKLWGMNPVGFHLTNVVLHALNAGLFYGLCVRFLKAASPGEPGGLRLAAAFSALLFAVHPLRVESVAWATERRDVLSGFCYLLTVRLYLDSLQAVGRKGLWLAAGSLAAFLLSLFAKGIGVSLPFALLLLDFYPLRRLSPDPREWFFQPARQVWLNKVPYLVCALGFGAIGLIGEARHVVMPTLGEMGFSARLAQSAYGALFYPWKTLLPFGLYPAYPPPPEMALAAPLFLFCALTALGITAAAVAWRRRFPAGLAVWGFYLLTLGPVIGLVKFGTQLAADRYSYLSCLGFAVLAGGALLWLLGAKPASRRFSLGVAAAVLAVLSMLTVRQIGVWRDSETLWRHTLALNPTLAVGRLNLALHLAEKGRDAEALVEYQACLSHEPGNLYAKQGLMNLGVSAMRRGSAGTALALYEKALALDLRDPQLFVNMAAALVALGRLGEAEARCRQALALDPEDKGARLNLGVLLARQGKLAEAALQFGEAVQTDPGYVDARYNLGLALKLLGRRNEAAAQFQEVLRLSPSHGEAGRSLRELVR